MASAAEWDVGGEQRPRKRCFSTEETCVLIRIWGSEEIQRSFDRSRKHSLIWKSVSSKMMDEGFTREPDECKNRIHNIKTEYSRIKKQLRMGDPHPTWVYWEEMNSVLGGWPVWTNDVDDSFNVSEESDSTEDASSSAEVCFAVENSRSGGNSTAPTKASQTETNHREKRQRTSGDEGIEILRRLLELEEEAQKRDRERDEEERNMYRSISDFYKTMNCQFRAQGSSGVSTNAFSQSAATTPLNSTTYAQVFNTFLDQISSASQSPLPMDATNMSTKSASATNNAQISTTRTDFPAPAASNLGTPSSNQQSANTTTINIVPKKPVSLLKKK